MRCYFWYNIKYVILSLGGKKVRYCCSCTERYRVDKQLALTQVPLVRKLPECNDSL